MAEKGFAYLDFGDSVVEERLETVRYARIHQTFVYFHKAENQSDDPQWRCLFRGLGKPLSEEALLRLLQGLYQPRSKSSGRRRGPWRPSACSSSPTSTQSSTHCRVAEDKGKGRRPRY